MSTPKWGCPDGGHCHHECETRCFRVLTCEPLSGVFARDEWPASLVALHEVDPPAVGP